MEIKKYIKQAQDIFIDKKEFDSERIAFIENLETCDLLAVPGSGKTTALLAKLYCLAENLPFKDNSGILILVCCFRELRVLRYSCQVPQFMISRCSRKISTER